MNGTPSDNNMFWGRVSDLKFARCHSRNCDTVKMTIHRKEGREVNMEIQHYHFEQYKHQPVKHNKTGQVTQPKIFSKQKAGGATKVMQFVKMQTSRLMAACRENRDKSTDGWCKMSTNKGSVTTHKSYKDMKIKRPLGGA